MPDRRHRAPNRSGIHFLSSRQVATQLVDSAGVGRADLVVDVGAGHGAVTAPLAATGATVLAVERDPEFVRRLHRRFAGQPAVRVVHADVRSVRLPHRAFQVVASIPFAVTTPLLRRVLNPPRPALSGADLIVEWGLARRLTGTHPRTLETAWWAARFQLRIIRRVPAGCFTPAPSVDAAHLAIRPHPGIDRRTSRVLWALLHAAYTSPRQPAWAVLGTLVPRKRARRLLSASGIDPPAPAAAVPVSHWAQLTAALAADPAIRPPSTPRPPTRRPGAPTATRRRHP